MVEELRDELRKLSRENVKREMCKEQIWIQRFGLDNRIDWHHPWSSSSEFSAEKLAVHLD